MGWRSTTLTVAAGSGPSSAELDLGDKGARRRKDLLLLSPDLASEVHTVHVAPVLGGTYVPLTEGGSNVVLVSSKAVPIRGLIAGALKIIGTGTIAADRVVSINGAAAK